MLSWCQAFDEWLAERERTYKPGINKPAVLAWRRLLHHCRQMPWELQPADIEEFAAWMQTAGYSPNTSHADMVFEPDDLFGWSGIQPVDAKVKVVKFPDGDRFVVALIHEQELI